MSETRKTTTYTVTLNQCPHFVSGSTYVLCRTNGAKKYGNYCRAHFNKLTPEQQVIVQDKAKGIANKAKESDRDQVIAAAAKLLTECKRLTLLVKTQEEEIAELKKLLSKRS